MCIVDLAVGCEPGTYNDEEGQHKCKDCPSGYYCLGNTTHYGRFVCPKGHYCPAKTPHPYYKPCPPGTYNDLMGGQNISACQDCTPGYYCSGWGNEATTDGCDPGMSFSSYCSYLVRHLQDIDKLYSEPNVSGIKITLSLKKKTVSAVLCWKCVICYTIRKYYRQSLEL